MYQKYKTGSDHTQLSTSKAMTTQLIQQIYSQSEQHCQYGTTHQSDGHNDIEEYLDRRRCPEEQLMIDACDIVCRLSGICFISHSYGHRRQSGYITQYMLL